MFKVQFCHLNDHYMMKDDWRLTAKRITKYAPSLRNEEGAYPADEWTSFHDIGKAFNGVTLTAEEYFRTEAKYIDAVGLFLKSIDCKEVRIVNVEKYDPEGLSGELLELYKGVLNGVLLDGDSIRYMIQLVLRGYLWCVMFCSKNQEYAIRFGYDYYMYFNGSNLKDSMLAEVECLGLFVDWRLKAP